MRGRRRKVSDAEIYEATQRVMLRVRPDELSLAAIAAEAGLTAGALVQRFGSRRALLLAVMAEWSAGTAELLTQFESRSPSPTERVIHYGECMAALGETPGALNQHLSYLQMDLADAEFRQHMLRSAKERRGALRRWISEAVEAGELMAATDPVEMARLIEAVIGGSLLQWAVYRQGSAKAWVRRDLQAVLAPWRCRKLGA